jgi:hypothetical protein
MKMYLLLLMSVVGTMVFTSCAPMGPLMAPYQQNYSGQMSRYNPSGGCAPGRCQQPHQQVVYQRPQQYCPPQRVMVCPPRQQYCPPARVQYIPQRQYCPPPVQRSCPPYGGQSYGGNGYGGQPQYGGSYYGGQQNSPFVDHYRKGYEASQQRYRRY